MGKYLSLFLLLITTLATSWAANPIDSANITPGNYNVIRQSMIIGQGSIYNINTYCNGSSSYAATNATCPPGSTPSLVVSLISTGSTSDSGIQYEATTFYNQWSLSTVGRGDGSTYYNITANKVYWDLVGAGCQATSHLDVSFVVYCS